jgi:hypothetical protein
MQKGRHFAEAPARSTIRVAPANAYLVAPANAYLKVESSSKITCAFARPRSRPEADIG